MWVAPWFPRPGAPHLLSADTHRCLPLTRRERSTFPQGRPHGHQTRLRGAPRGQALPASQEGRGARWACTKMHPPEQQHKTQRLLPEDQGSA